MRLVSRVLNRLARPFTRPARIAKPSDRAAEVADLLNGKLRLSSQTKAAVRRICAAMEDLTQPYPRARADGFRTLGDHFRAMVGGPGSVREHFRLVSSDEWKLAALEALVRYRDAASVLEIGTAYGVSAVTLARAQRVASLLTLESSEPQASIGRRNIAVEAPSVACLAKSKEEALPALVREGRRFDFVFHDGGHSGDAYVDDFATLLPALESGAIYVVDDILWDELPKVREVTRTFGSRRSCREGWDELVSHDRVDGALTFRSHIGILLIS